MYGRCLIIGNNAVKLFEYSIFFNSVKPSRFILCHNLLYQHLPGKLKQNILSKEFLLVPAKAVYIMWVPGNSDVLL